jgi:hypothetical protein
MEPPTKAAIPADLTSTSLPFNLSRNSISAVGLRQILPMQTIRTFFNTATSLDPQPFTLRIDGNSWP